MIKTCTKLIEKRCSKYDLLTRLYGLYYKNLVKKEIKLANVKSCDKVLCVGGGAIPCTAIEFAKQTNAQIHVVDMDDTAVECARCVVKKLGLDDKITVISGKGEEIDVEPYDVIHVALQVSPKEKVLENIWERSKEGNRIIVRMPRKRLRSFYSNISDDFIKENVKEVKSISVGNKPSTMDEILLMEKI